MKKISLVIPAGKNNDVEVLNDSNRYKFNIIIERGKNPSENRNRGIKKSKTEFIAFINAHTILSKNWYEEVVTFFKKYSKIDIVGGPQLNYKYEGFFAKTSGYALASIFGSAAVSVRYKKTDLNLNADETQLTSANLICKKRVFKKTKFDETIYPGEDPKFISDAKEAGFNIAYSPDIIVYNKRRTGPFLLAEQIFNYGEVRPQKESFMETLKKPFFLIPSLFFIYLLILPLLLIFNLLFILPLGIYTFLNILFSFYESLKNGNIFSITILPIIFFIIHISYGAGFLKGLINPLYK